MSHLMKTQLTTNLERDQLKTLKKTEVPRIPNTTINEANPEEDQEMEEPQEHIDPPQEKNTHKRKPAWVQEAIQGA